MAYPEYDPNEPSLGQTFADLLRGVKNPKSWQEVGQGIQNTAKVLPSVGESLGRGALVQLPALAGDVSQTARQIAPETMQNTFGNRYMPTSEEILAKVPRMTPDYQGSQSHEMMGGILSPAMPFLLRAGAEATKGLPIGNMIAYHGTPHEIKGAFDMSKVGTGEGAQAYGHGIYFAENPSVADQYRKDLSAIVNYDQNTKKYQVLDKNRKMLGEYDNMLNAGQEAEKAGNLYKVDIPDAYIPTMMDYDKPLGQQSAIVKKALNEIKKQITPEMKMELGGDMNLLFGKDITPVQFLNTMEIIHPTGGVGIGEKMLNELGVKGMRYLDATSRDTGKGTSNFVVFDPKEVKILEKNGKSTRKDVLEQAFEGTMPHYKNYENLSGVFEKAGLKIKETGSSKSNSKYVEIQDPVSGEVITARFANHPQSGNAMTLHGPADIEIGDIFKHKSWEDAVNPILDRINKARKEFGDQPLILNNKIKK